MSRKGKTRPRHVPFDAGLGSVTAVVIQGVQVPVLQVVGNDRVLVRVDENFTMPAKLGASEWPIQVRGGGKLFAVPALSIPRIRTQRTKEVPHGRD